MRKLILYFLLSALILPIAFAETKIFSGKAITDTDKSIEGGIFRFKYDEASNKVFAQTPTTNMIIDNGACKSNEVFRVCINSANFSYKNITSYIYYYEVDVAIYKLTGSLSSSVKSTSSELLQSEFTDLALTVTNPTDFDIAGILLDFDLSPFFVKELKGCGLEGKHIKWDGSLKPKYDKTCTATISADEEGTYILSGNLTYFNGFEAEKKQTSSVTIKVLPKQLKASYIIDKSIEVKKPFYINISLKNIHSSEDLEMSAAIKLPSHVSLIKDKPAFSKDGRILRNSLKLEPGNIFNYSLYLEASSEGQEPINYKYVYTIKGLSDAIENNTYVLANIQQLSIPAEVKKQEPSNDIVVINTTTNATTATESIQGSQDIDKNKTAAAELQAENKISEKTAAEKITIAKDSLSSKFFNKKILLFVSTAFIAFLIVFFAINKVKKRKKEGDELAERIRERLKASIGGENK